VGGGNSTTTDQRGLKMICVGRFSSTEKWEIICRYWQDPNAVADPNESKFGVASLPAWHASAFSGGGSACLESVHAIVARKKSVSEVPYDVRREFIRLSRRIGRDALERHIDSFVNRITSGGFSPMDDLRLSPAAINHLRGVFKDGALRYLQWTDDRGEVPTIDLLRSRKGAVFPTAAATGRNEVLSLFCGAFCGRNDVIHLYDTHPGHVTLLDANAEFMKDMQLIYPGNWTYVTEDYRSFLSQARDRQLSYDLIISDNPAGDPIGSDMVWRRLPTIMEICSGLYITNFFDLPACRTFEELCVDDRENLQGLSHALKTKSGIDVEVVEILQRNKTVYWAVISKEGAENRYLAKQRGTRLVSFLRRFLRVR
jgi:hypothetical protein